MNESSELYLPEVLADEDIDALCRALEENPDRDLYLRRNVKFRSPLAQARLIQFLISWAQRADPSRSFTTTIQKSSDQEELSGYLHGALAPALGRPILDRTTRTNYQPTLLKQSLDRLKVSTPPDQELFTFGYPRLQNYAVYRGDLAMLRCYDDKLRDIDYLKFYPELYERTETRPLCVRDARAIGNLLIELLTARLLGKYFKGIHSQDGIRTLAFKIGSALSELFENAHEWGRHIPSGVAIQNSVRAIIIQGIDDSTAKNTRLDSNKSDPISDYTKQVQDRFAKDALKFVAISIVDSGVGFVRRFTRLTPEALAEMSLPDEYNIVRKCFSYRATSSSDSRRGVGLHSVLRELSNPNVAGFIYLRTGRLCLYRNLSTHGYDGGTSIDNYWLTDWTTRRSDTLTSQGLAAGALVSFIFPIKLGARK